MTLLRNEDKRLITGQGKFTADWQVDGQLHAAMVRSDRAHANILSIDTKDALESPGVELILTAADVEQAGFTAIPSGPDIVGKDGMKQHKAPLPLLASDRVRYVGQPIAMVVAQTAMMARDAAEQVLIDYEELPAVSSAANAIAPGAPSLHADAKQNTSLVYEAGDRDAVSKAFASAAKTSTLKIGSQRLYGAPMEPRACMASHDAAANLTRVYTPTQGMLGMRASLCAVTKSEPEQIEVISQDVGGSFGLRGSTYPEQALTVLASRKLGRAVKWVGSRSELFMGEWHGRSLMLEGSIALDADNRITAIRFNDQVDLGAYNCYFGGFIGTNNLSVTMGGVYRVPALHMQSQLIYTNASPVSAYRGAGRPDIAFAIERLVDHCAAEHGLDRVAFRRQNFVPADAFPYQTAYVTEYDCGNFEAVLNKTLALADFDGFSSRRQASAAKGLLRGIGFGCYIEKSGAGGAPKDQVSCRFHRKGRLVLHAVSGSSGQGHETSFAQIVGEGLGIDPTGIDYKAGDPSLTLVGNGTGGSRSLYGTGSAFKNLVGTIIAKARPQAAAALGVSADSLIFEKGAFSGGGKTIELLALAEQLATKDPAEHPLNAEAETSTGANFPNGCHLAEIEVDPQTGHTRVLNYVAVDDLGYVVSPTLVRGQVHGGVVQGYGQAFTEQIVYDDANGQLLSGSFMDYAMPKAGSIEQIRCEWENVPTALNELGAKGVGESGCSGSLPALSNAMMDALAGVGAGPIDMPYTPARVWAAIEASS